LDLAYLTALRLEKPDNSYEWFSCYVWHFLKVKTCFLAEIWEWEDEDKNWHGYDASSCRLLEASQLCGVDKISIASLGRSYSIDLKRMVQKNEETKTERRIQRVDNSSLTGTLSFRGHNKFLGGDVQ